MKKIKMIFIAALVVSISSAHAQIIPSAASTIAIDGGATSGGGDELGIEAKQVFREVVTSLDQIPGLYTQTQKDLMKKRFESIRSVIVVNEELPAPNLDHTFGHVFIQDGTAWSSFDGTYSDIKLNYDKFSKISDPLTLEGLMHHELAVLADIEKTGDYTYTDQFLANREKFFESQSAQYTQCTVSLFDKNGSVPGNLLGTAATKWINNAETTNGVGLIYYLEKRTKKHPKAEAIVMGYVLGGNGYFRVKFLRSETTEPASTSSDDIAASIGEGVALTPDIIFYNPYQWAAAAREARLREFDFGFIMVSCARL